MEAQNKSADARPMVEFRDVHVVFHQRLKRPVHALRGFSLQVPCGAIMGLLGPNGSGKTTAFSSLQGLLLPQAGQILIDGVTDTTRTACGVLLEDTRLPPFLSVRQALELSCRLRGITPNNATAEAQRLIELLHLDELLDRRVSVLSKGQARRVGLAAALVGDPPLLILDEPSAGMDVEARVEFESLLRGLNDGKRTVLVASHLLSDIQNTCTHVAIIRQGSIATSGRVSELLKQPEDAPPSDIHIGLTHTAALEKLGFQFEESRYSGAVRLTTDSPDAEVLGKLLAEGITPTRMEPRTDLISVYLSWTEGGDAP